QLAQVAGRDESIRGYEPLTGCNHEGARHVFRRSGECVRIGQLAAEIQPAYKRKRFTERHAVAAQANCQVEIGIGPEQKPSAFTAHICRREQEDAISRGHSVVSGSGPAGGTVSTGCPCQGFTRKRPSFPCVTKYSSSKPSASEGRSRRLKVQITPGTGIRALPERPAFLRSASLSGLSRK